MKLTKIIMGMPITIEVESKKNPSKIIKKAYEYFEYVDTKFSQYKEISEITKFNNGWITKKNTSKDFKEILSKSSKTKKETDGYFDIYRNGFIDPSGIVKGWGIFNASKIIKENGFDNFYIEAGGDIEAQGKNKDGQSWRFGIRNPFNKKEIVKIISLSNKGVATSGLYERGNHIYNPHDMDDKLDKVVSLTVIGKNIYEADRFATAAFAMGEKGIYFIEGRRGFEGYMIKKDGRAMGTSGFNKYEVD